MKPTVLGVILVSHSVLEAILVEPKDTWEEAIQEQQYNHTDASQFSLTPSLLR